jgi:hypothetical protein
VRARPIALMMVLAIVAPWAAADATLDFRLVYEQDGYRGFMFSAVPDPTDNDPGGWAFNIDFFGRNGNCEPDESCSPVQHWNPFGYLPITTQEQAEALDGFSGPLGTYNMHQDSWVTDNFPIVLPGGVAEEETVFSINVGSNWGVLWMEVDAVYVVASGNCEIGWEGTLARHGREYPVSGCTPEPASASLLILGAAALLRRRR